MQERTQTVLRSKKVVGHVCFLNCSLLFAAQCIWLVLQVISEKLAKKTSAKIKAKISLVLKAECFCSDSDCVLLFCHLRLSQFVLERLSELPALISHCCTFLLSLALSFESSNLAKLNIDTFHHILVLKMKCNLTNPPYPTPP